MDIKINESQYSEIKLFCELNKIQNIQEFINECITIGFNVKQFGTTPFIKKSEYKDLHTTKKNRIIPTVPKKERSQYNLGVGDKTTITKKNDLYDE